jgi:hypothetical protein
MSCNNHLKDAEEADQVCASLPEAVFDEPAKPDSAPSIEPTHEEEKDGARDLEALENVTTGPAYSAFTIWQKRYIVIMVTWAAFISPASANTYLPALNALQQELKVSTTLINLTLTSYMIFQGLAPTSTSCYFRTLLPSFVNILEQRRVSAHFRAPYLSRRM